MKITIAICSYTSFSKLFIRKKYFKSCGYLQFCVSSADILRLLHPALSWSGDGAGRRMIGRRGTGDACVFFFIFCPFVLSNFVHFFDTLVSFPFVGQMLIHGKLSMLIPTRRADDPTRRDKGWETLGVRHACQRESLRVLCAGGAQS